MIEQYWDGKGPILFYTGNEGDITSFWNNTGFVTTTLPPMFNGLVVFAGTIKFFFDNIHFYQNTDTMVHLSLLVNCPLLKNTFDTLPLNKLWLTLLNLSTTSKRSMV